MAFLPVEFAGMTAQRYLQRYMRLSLFFHAGHLEGINDKIRVL
jgi:hypothetical protein